MNYLGYEISSGIDDLTILTSGVIHIAPDKNFHITLDELTYRFYFADDAGDKRYEGKTIEPIVDSKVNYCVTFYNHQNPIGEGVFEPIHIGATDRHTFSFTYYVMTMPNKSRSFQYVLYRGDK